MSIKSTENLNQFLNALDAIKKSQICGVCGVTCKEPVVLKKCFHWICAHHTELKQCPNCNTSLEDNNETFIDKRINRCIEYTSQLSHVFDKFTSDNTIASTSKGNIKRSDFTSNKSSHETNDTKVNKTKKAVSKDTSKKASSDNATTKKLLTDISSDKNLLSEKSSDKKLFVDKSSNKKQEKTRLQKPMSNKTNLQQNLNETLLSNVSSNIRSNEKRNINGETALHVACRLGKVEKIQELLAAGANVNTKDNAGWTPLHEVVQNGKLDLVILLLQYNTLINVPGQSNETPLHEAVRYNHSKIAEELVKHGADINIRNCKGETPYQLASINMKNTLLTAAENVLHTQSVNISHLSALYENLGFENIHVYCVSQYRSVHSKLKTLMKHHNNLSVEATLTKKVTHMIIDDEDGVCTSSLEVLQGVVNHLWILSTQWVTKSSETKLELFHPYEIKGIGTETNNGPQNSRYNKYKQLPGLFDGCHFYIHNLNTKYEITKSLVLNKTILAKLIGDAGGVILRRVPNPELIPETEKLVPYHASKSSKLYNCSHYIIFKDMYEPMYNMQHLKALPVGWLIECLEKYELCDP